MGLTGKISDFFFRKDIIEFSSDIGEVCLPETEFEIVVENNDESDKFIVEENKQVIIPKVTAPKIQQQGQTNSLSFRAACKFKILIVDDSLVNRIYIKELCNIWEICVDEASSGEDAVAMAAENQYNMIFMDVRLPGIDGYSATGLIRDTQNGLNQNTPVVALTADIVTCNKSIAKKMGMDDFLSKPYKPGQLFSVLNSYLAFKSEEEMEEAGKIEFLGNAKWIDYEELIDLYDDDVDHMTEMFSIFLKNTSEEFKKMQVSFKEKNAGLLGEQAHKIKPTFSMVGIKNELTGNFFYIEQKAKKNELDQEMFELIFNLEEHLEECFNEVRNELEHLRSL